jgi:hypothetical protein
MKDASATLQGGLKASEPQGTPISAKFEIEDGKLQLSIYTMKGNDFMEVVADPKSGAIAKAEKITDAEDLKAATSQKTAMAKAKVSLLTAAETAVKGNPGLRGQHLSGAEGWKCGSRSDLAARDHIQEGNREAGLSRAGVADAKRTPLRKSRSINCQIRSAGCRPMALTKPAGLGGGPSCENGPAANPAGLWTGQAALQPEGELLLQICCTCAND